MMNATSEGMRSVPAWKAWLWLVPLALLAGFWAVPRLRHPQAKAEEEAEHEAAAVLLTPAEVVTVRSGRIADVIRATGTLEPLPNGRATVAAEVAGRVLDLSLKPGDPVEGGQVVARVYRTDLTAEAQKTAAAAAEARREVAALQELLALQEATAAARARQVSMALAEARAKRDRVRAGNRPEEIERAEAQLASARADLERLRSGPRPQEIRQAEAAVRQADAEVEVARRAVTRLTTLVAKGVAAAKERERAEADLARSQATQASAQEALALLRQGTRAEEIRAQEARVREAQAQVSLLRQGARPEEIREAEAAVAQAQAKLAEAAAQRRMAAVTRAQIRAAQERLRAAEAAASGARSVERQTVVRAPFSGVVSKLLANAGEVVPAGGPIAELESRKTLRLLLQVPTAHQARLRPGLPVTVSLPHQPGVSYGGRVRVIDPAADPATGTVTAEVWLPNRERRLRSGMVVTAEVRASSEATSLVVPSQSVSAMEGEQYVYRLDSKEHTVHRVPVKLGVEKDETVQILEGLKAGDLILRDGNRSVADESPYELVGS
jgi:HlyD family secretion protein